jgi:hypothetical protein
MIWIIHQQRWEYKVEKELDLEVRINNYESHDN